MDYIELLINYWHCLISGKILIIGGGIANFTNVAATFKVSYLIQEEIIIETYFTYILQFC